MYAIARLSLLLSPLLIAACAATAPPAKEFPAGARAPTAAELTTLLRGKSYTFAARNGNTVRTDYAAEGNGLTVYFPGGLDRGTWRTEDGKACFELKTLPSVCNEVRLVGPQVWLKRGTSGDVVLLSPR